MGPFLCPQSPRPHIVRRNARNGAFLPWNQNRKTRADGEHLFVKKNHGKPWRKTHWQSYVHDISIKSSLQLMGKRWLLQGSQLISVDDLWVELRMYIGAWASYTRWRWKSWRSRCADFRPDVGCVCVFLFPVSRGINKTGNVCLFMFFFRFHKGLTVSGGSKMGIHLEHSGCWCPRLLWFVSWGTFHYPWRIHVWYIWI